MCESVTQYLPTSPKVVGKEFQSYLNQWDLLPIENGVLYRPGFPKLLVDRYPLDTVAGLHVTPKCCDVSLKQGGPTSSLLRATFRNCSSL